MELPLQADPLARSPLVPADELPVDDPPGGGGRPSEVDGQGRTASAALPGSISDPPSGQAGPALGVIQELPGTCRGGREGS